jgi:tetratricopeptide (TPR) repeat protein/predicted HTH domain antitoxin
MSATIDIARPAPLPPLGPLPLAQVLEKRAQAGEYEGSLGSASSAEFHAQGIQALLRGDTARATEAIERYWDLTKTPYAYSLLGMAYAQTGRLDEAIHYLEETIRLQPGDADSHLTLGMVHFKREEWQEAIDSFTVVTRLAPSNATPYFYLGYANASLNRREEAIDNYMEAIRLRSDYLIAYHYFARLCLDLGLANEHERVRRFNEAISLYKQLLEIDPRDASARNNIGFLYRQLGNIEAAVEEYARAVEVNGNDLFALLNLGNTHLELRQYEEARSAYRRIVELIETNVPDVYDRNEPTYEGVRHVLSEAQSGFGAASRLLYSSQDIERKDPQLLREAEAALDVAIGLDPDHSNAYIDLGALYHLLGHLPEADAAFRRALNITPDSRVARYNMRLHQKKLVAAAVLTELETARHEGREPDVKALVDAAVEAHARIVADEEAAKWVGPFTAEDLLQGLAPVAEELGIEARFAFAARLFERRLLSSGKAAHLAGVDRVSFLLNLHRVGVAVHDLDETEMENEARYANSY